MSKAFSFSMEYLKRFKPSMAYAGQNVAHWQKESREKLRELLGLDTFIQTELLPEIEYETKTEGATEMRFTFQSEEGYRVPCVMLLPDGVEKPPVMICLQGHSTGMHISLGRAVYPGVEDRCTMVTGNGGHRFFADDAWPVVHQYLG